MPWIHGVDRATRLVKLRERYLAGAARSRSRLGEVATLLFANPFTTVRRVETTLGVTNQGARNLIRDAESRGWLEPVAVLQRSRQSFWVAREVLDIIDAPPMYQSAAPGRATSAT